MTDTDAGAVTPDDILDFWFGTLTGPTDHDPAKAKLWWGGSKALDEEIGERFGARFEQARSGALDAWLDSPRSALALIILLDQFSRNLGRGTPDAFASDAKAQSICLAAIDRGHDAELRPIERGFLYMPLMHAESRELAARSVALFEALSDDTKRRCPSDHPDFLPHAKQHAEIVQRFGRYPHRNQILGRSNTAEEEAFLQAGGPSFGQQKR